MLTKPSTSKKRVRLATFSVMTEIWIPYASGCLQAFAKSDSRINDHFDFLPILYKPLDDKALREALADVDVLGLTCYVWNQHLNSRVSQIFREINPDGILIWGGPQIPKDPLDPFFSSNGDVDFFACGQGELVFKDLLLYLTGNFPFPAGQVIARDSNFNTTSDFRATADQKALMQSFQSPYLTGEFEHIFKSEQNITAVFESNRGCPFSCAFCDWGGQSNSKVDYLGKELLRLIIDKIFSLKNIRRVVLTDANLGLKKDDLELIDYMIATSERTGHSPTIVYGGLIKNGSPYLLEILEKIYTKLSIDDKNLKLSFQSHTKSVLDILDRKNISNLRLLSLLEPLKEKGISLTSEMIIGLPGENAESWLGTLEKDFMLNMSYMRTYNLIVTANTQLSTISYKQKHGIKTKLVRFPYSFGTKSPREMYLHRDKKYATSLDVTPSFETYEIIYSADSFNFDELMKMHSYHWVYHNFINTNLLREFFNDCIQRGFTVSNLIKIALEIIEESDQLNSILSRHLEKLSVVFRPEPETIIDNLESYYILLRDMRAHDVFDIANNFESIASILTQKLTLPISQKDYLTKEISRISSLARSKNSFRVSQALYGGDVRLLDYSKSSGQANIAHSLISEKESVFRTAKSI